MESVHLFENLFFHKTNKWVSILWTHLSSRAWRPSNHRNGENELWVPWIWMLRTTLVRSSLSGLIVRKWHVYRCLIRCFKHHIMCTSSHFVYYISSSKYAMLYIGETGRFLRQSLMSIGMLTNLLPDILIGQII